MSLSATSDVLSIAFLISSRLDSKFRTFLNIKHYCELSDIASLNELRDRSAIIFYIFHDSTVVCYCKIQFIIVQTMVL